MGISMVHSNPFTASFVLNEKKKKSSGVKKYTFTKKKGDVDYNKDKANEDYVVIPHDDEKLAIQLAKEWAQAMGHKSLYQWKKEDLKEGEICEVLEEGFFKKLFGIKDPESEIHYNSEYKMFNGHVNGHPVKTMKEPGLYKHLTTVHGFSNEKAAAFIKAAKEGWSNGETSKNPVVDHFKHIAYHVDKAHAAHLRGDHGIRDEHLSHAIEHLNHLSKMDEKDIQKHPEAKEYIKHIGSKLKDIKEGVNEELKFHGDTEMFHGSYKGIPIKPSKDALKQLVDTFNMPPDKAFKMVSKARASHDNKTAIDRHLKFAEHWKKKSEKHSKTNNKAKAKNFLKGVKFHMKQAKGLGYDEKTWKEEIEPVLTDLLAEGVSGSDFFEHLEETGELAQMPQDIIEKMEDWFIEQEQLNEAVTNKKNKLLTVQYKNEKGEPYYLGKGTAKDAVKKGKGLGFKSSKTTYEDFDTANYFVKTDNMYRGTNLGIDEDYLSELMTQMLPFFSEEQAFAVLTNEDLDNETQSRLGYWLKSGRMNGQRLARAQSSLENGLLAKYSLDEETPEDLEEDMVPYKPTPPPRGRELAAGINAARKARMGQLSAKPQKPKAKPLGAQMKSGLRKWWNDKSGKTVKQAVGTSDKPGKFGKEAISHGNSAKYHRIVASGELDRGIGLNQKQHSFTGLARRVGGANAIAMRKGKEQEAANAFKNANDHEAVARHHERLKAKWDIRTKFAGQAIKKGAAKGKALGFKTEDIEDLMKNGFSEGEAVAMLTAAHAIETGGESTLDEVSRAHMQAAVNHVHSVPEHLKQGVSEAHATLLKSMNHNFKHDRFAGAVDKGKVYQEKNALPRLTRKDFEHIAHHIRHIPDAEVKEHMTRHYTEVGHRANPLFNPHRFLKACGHE